MTDVDAFFIAFGTRHQSIKINDKVHDVCDPRHVGKVHIILDGVALVQFGWRGRLALIRVSDLRKEKP